MDLIMNLKAKNMKKKYMKLQVLSLVLVLLMSFILNIDQLNSSPVIAVYFYVWYGNPENSHWNNSIYNIVVDKPLIGYYSSIDESTIRWQLNLIKQASIDVLFISWWGPGSYEDKAAKKVFLLLKEYGLKAAIMIEPYLGNNASLYTKEWWNKVLNYIYVNYVLMHKDVYFYWMEKPLILAFNPIGEVYKPIDSRFTIRIVGNDNPYIDWDYWSYSPRIRYDGYVAILPRYDDYYLYLAGARESYTRLDPDYSQRVYENCWNFVLSHKNVVKLIVICSWNEYHERTMIEPHYDATSTIDIYQETVKYINMIGKPNTLSTIIYRVLIIALTLILVLALLKRILRTKIT